VRFLEVVLAAKEVVAMADKCTLLKTDTETACLKTDEGCFLHQRDVSIYWCCPDGSDPLIPGNTNCYEVRTYGDWKNTGAKCDCGTATVGIAPVGATEACVTEAKPSAYSPAT
jgi:hypothetical protein